MSARTITDSVYSPMDSAREFIEASGADYGIQSAIQSAWGQDAPGRLDTLFSTATADYRGLESLPNLSLDNTKGSGTLADSTTLASSDSASSASSDSTWDYATDSRTDSDGNPQLSYDDSTSSDDQPYIPGAGNRHRHHDQIVARIEQRADNALKNIDGLAGQAIANPDAMSGADRGSLQTSLGRIMHFRNVAERLGAMAVLPEFDHTLLDVSTALKQNRRNA